MPAIFLIEDNAYLRENTKIMLELNGYEVSGFDSGPPALEKLKEMVPDLVLCDIILPGISGYDILSRVRQLPSGGEVPFVFLTALAEQDQVREGMNLGADDYVTKPFTSASLLAAVKTRLERSVKRQTAAELEFARYQAQKLEYFPHEIRTPLSAIIGAIGILRADEKMLVGDSKDVLDLMEEATTRLERTALNYILYLSLSAGHAPFQSTVPVEAGLLVASVATRVAQEAGRENDLLLHTVETLTHCGNCLDRIVSEVVSNAFKFSPPGSKVEVEMSWAGGHLTLSFRDHGCGMTEEEIAAIGPFKQFHRKNREQQGLGLGLAICKAQIKCAGCHLTFKPLEPGLEVMFTLPEQCCGPTDTAFSASGNL